MEITRICIGDDAEVLVMPLVDGPTRRYREQLTTARLLAEAFGSDRHPELTHTPSGAPRLSMGSGEQWHVSVSHSRTRGALALSRKGPVGIDVEEWREQLLRVRHKYLSASDHPGWERTEALMLDAWMAKEAAYKAMEPRGVTLLSVHLGPPGPDTMAECQGRRALVRFAPGMAVAVLIP